MAARATGADAASGASSAHAPTPQGNSTARATGSRAPSWTTAPRPPPTRRAPRAHPGRRPPPPRRPGRRRRGRGPRPARLRLPRPGPARQGLRAHRLRPGRLRPVLRRARRRRPALDLQTAVAGSGEAAVAAFARARSTHRRRYQACWRPRHPRTGRGARQGADRGRVRCHGACRAAQVGEQLCQHHCPVAHVAEQFPQLCEAETEVFSRLLGTHVQRLATIAHGDGVCTTFIPGRTGPPRPPAAGRTAFSNAAQQRPGGTPHDAPTETAHPELEGLGTLRVRLGRPRRGRRRRQARPVRGCRPRHLGEEERAASGCSSCGSRA